MKWTIIAIIIAVAIIAGALMLSPKNGASPTTDAAKGDNVSIVNGKQIIEMTAKGGFYPQKSAAKAGMPTLLRVKTDGTFDCSSIVRIPSLGIKTFLPPTGTTDIDLGSPRATTLQGMCGMGMYSFEVEFS